MSEPKPNEGIKVIVLGGVAVIMLFGLVSRVLQSATPEAESVSAAQPAPKTCQQAAGNIIDGITLYSDSSCSTAVGTVAGIGKTPGGQKTVFVSNGGETEQVSRDKATEWYVKN
jgi:hypothetical protein